MREIERGEPVVLDFDTATNAIPDTFLFYFCTLFRNTTQDKKQYESFTSAEKSILVCSYPAFTGLQHATIAVAIDRNIYNVQHYLVQTLARCTADFCIVVLKNRSTLKDVTAEWKSKQMIEK